MRVDLSGGGSLRAQYLVGCDGGRSTVRKAAAIAFPGTDATTNNLIAEVEMTDVPELGTHHGALVTYSFGKRDYEIRAGRIIWKDGGPIRVMMPERQPGATSEPTLHDLREALLAVCGTDHGVHSPTWISRFTDMDIVVANGPMRVFELLHDAKPLLLNFAPPAGLDIAPWSGRVRAVNAKYTGPWVLPVIGVVDAPVAVLIRPDGHVAWVGDGTDAGLAEAMTCRFCTR